MRLPPHLELVTGDMSRNSTNHEKNFAIGLIADRWESMVEIIDRTKDFKPEDLAAVVLRNAFEEGGHIEVRAFREAVMGSAGGELQDSGRKI